MSSGRLASTVCPHVGGKADPCSATSAVDCAGQVTRWSCLFKIKMSRFYGSVCNIVDGVSAA